VVAVVDWPDAEQGVFAISFAAELSGLHPQTLRVYEREGLIDPERSVGGTRRYSGHDVQRLRHIAGLTDIGINIAGIKMVLQLQEENRRLQAQIQKFRARLQEPERQKTKNSPAISD
jgi:MerR family transcriptional regulator, heat shock protein HspR